MLPSSPEPLEVGNQIAQVPRGFPQGSFAPNGRHGECGKAHRAIPLIHTCGCSEGLGWAPRWRWRESNSRHILQLGKMLDAMAPPLEDWGRTYDFGTFHSAKSA